MLIFYSRKPEQASQIAEFCDNNGFQLIAQSLIRFEAAPIEKKIPLTDVLFFTSPRAFDFYLQSNSIEKKQELACLGSRTKNHMVQNGFNVSFFGLDSTKPLEVALDFKTWLGDRTVLFPVSNISNRSVQQVLSDEQIYEVVVYHTIPKAIHLPVPPDVLIFSSPSNAEAYLQQNQVSDSQKIACFGTTTQQFLKSKNIEAIILKSPDENGVMDYLSGVL